MLPSASDATNMASAAAPSVAQMIAARLAPMGSAFTAVESRSRGMWRVAERDTNWQANTRANTRIRSGADDGQAHDPFRVMKRSAAMRSSRLATCAALAYRCGGSTSWRVLADCTSCFPFDRARMACIHEHQGAASVRAAQRHVKKAGLRAMCLSQGMHARVG
jgi:hypothetical protein